MGDSWQSWRCGSLFPLTRSERYATIRPWPAAYPSGPRGRIANPLFVGSNPTAAFTLEQRGAFQATRCLASWPRCVPGVARSAASACAAAWASAPVGAANPTAAFTLEQRGAFQATKRHMFGYLRISKHSPCGFHPYLSRCPNGEAFFETNQCRRARVDQTPSPSNNA